MFILGYEKLNESFIKAFEEEKKSKFVFAAMLNKFDFYKLDQVKKYAYLNEFFIQRKNSSALLDLFYDSKEYVSRKDSNLHRECLDSGSEKNCSIGAINSYFNENGENKELFTLADWTKSLNSSIMSYGLFVKAQQSTIMYRERKFQKVVDLR